MDTGVLDRVFHCRGARLEGIEMASFSLCRVCVEPGPSTAFIQEADMGVTRTVPIHPYPGDGP